MQRQCSESGTVFSSVCLCMCLTLEPFEISSRNIYGSKIWLKAQTSSRMAAFRCTGRSTGDVRTYAPFSTIQDPPLWHSSGDLTFPTFQLQYVHGTDNRHWVEFCFTRQERDCKSCKCNRTLQQSKLLQAVPVGGINTNSSSFFVM